MAFIITKLVDGKFMYYLSPKNKWEGLKDNAKIIKQQHELDYLLAFHRKYYFNNEINYIKAK